MLKLNEKGWGLTTFVSIIGVLFVALLVVVFLVNFYDTGLSKKGSGNIIMDQEEKTTYDYPAYERELEEKAMEYAYETGLVILEVDDYVKINIDNLERNSKYNHCQGYVKISKALENEDYIFDAYISCGLYKTTGYE